SIFNVITGSVVLMNQHGLARLARHVAVASCQRRSEADLVLDTVGDRQAEVRVEALRRFQVGVTGRIQK
ncbi:MAG: hypothetical protein KDI55_21300, partial [Anaerolineae bacterium]|nr:hypothetical protein [Anaerolineae bacterium]